MTANIQANSFQFASTTTISDVHFDVMQEVPSGSTYSGSIDYFIYANNSGAPGTQLATGLVTVGETDLGAASQVGFELYNISFLLNTPFTANAGTTYWLGLHNGPLSNNTNAAVYWTWSTGGSGTTSQLPLPPGSWSSATGAPYYFFQLTNDGVAPEPASMVLIASGIAGMALLARRRNQGARR